MARYILYPAIGETVLDENGAEIPVQGGGPYLITPFYQDKLLRGLLLRVDPLASGETPNLPPGPRTYLLGSTTLSLPARSGAVDGELVVTSGASTPNDGGGATWRFALGISAGADGSTKINSSNGQWQRCMPFGRGYLTSELAGVRGAYANEMITLHGRDSFNDGAHGIARWDPASTTPEDGAMVWGTGTGRWKRIFDPAYINVRWFGARENVTDNSPPIQAAINAAYGFGADIYIPHGAYKCASTIKMRNLGPGPNYNGRIRGDTYGGFRQGGSRLIWTGPYYPAGHADQALSVLFQAGAPDCTFEGIEFTDAGNAEAVGATRCCCLVNIGGSPGEAVVYNEHETFRSCKFQGGDYCIVIDFNLVGTGNSQDNSFRDCVINSARVANVWLRHTVQPYSTNFYLCYVTNFLGPNPEEPPVTNTPYGVGWLVETDSCSITVQDCDIQRFGIQFLLIKAPQSLVLMNNHSEVCKKMLVACQAFNTLSTISIVGGRHSEEGSELQSYGPLSSFPANDYVYIEARCSVPITITGVEFITRYEAYPNWFISLQGNDLISRGNRYPHLRPFRRRDNGTGNGYSGSFAQCRGRTFSEGDLANNSSAEPAKMPVLRGCENGGGRVTFAVGESSKHVTFDRDEPSHDQFGTLRGIEYNVNLAIRSITGAFTQPGVRAANIARDGFDIVLTAAVPAGTGNAVEVSYDIWSGGYMP